MKLCKVEGCGKPLKARGYCGRHYGILVQRPNAPRRPPREVYRPLQEHLCWLGENMYAACRYRRVPFRTLPQRSGVHYDTLLNICRGDREPQLATINSVAAALGCEAWELLKPGHFAERLAQKAAT